MPIPKGIFCHSGFQLRGKEITRNLIAREHDMLIRTNPTVPSTYNKGPML